jgi:phosphopantothenate---cysteine ligase (CTP)
MGPAVRGQVDVDGRHGGGSSEFEERTVGMHCIVTAGPTAEPLDEVRRLTNASTGRLGVGLGDYLMGQGCRVTLLRSRFATFSSLASGQTAHEFGTTAELESCLSGLAGEGVDAVFHVAAVSDFTFGRVYDRVTPGWLVERAERKLDTAGRDLIVELKPTPKLIARLAEWFPRACRVGWKYEMDGNREQAVVTAWEQIGRYGTHACVANGLAYGSGYGLVTGGGGCRHYGEVEALYAGLWELLRGFGASMQEVVDALGKR